MGKTLTTEQTMIIGRIMAGTSTTYDNDLCTDIATECRRLSEVGDDCFLFVWAVMTASLSHGRRQVAADLGGMAAMVLNSEADIRNKLMSAADDDGQEG